MPTRDNTETADRFESDTEISVTGHAPFKATDIRMLSGSGKYPPFGVLVQLYVGESVWVPVDTEEAGKLLFTEIQEQWIAVTGVDDDYVGLTEEGRDWQAAHPEFKPSALKLMYATQPS